MFGSSPEQTGSFTIADWSLSCGDDLLLTPRLLINDDEDEGIPQDISDLTQLNKAISAQLQVWMFDGFPSKCERSETMCKWAAQLCIYAGYTDELPSLRRARLEAMPKADEPDEVIMKIRKDHPHCYLCGTKETPQWRAGPDGPRSLCNACGIIWHRTKKYEIPEKKKRKKRKIKVKN